MNIRIAEEYKLLIGFPIAFFLTEYLISSFGLETVFPIIFVCISFYSIYRHSILFQRFRLPDQRFFLKKNSDQSDQRNQKYLGFSFLSLGILWAIVAPYFNVEQRLYILINYSMILTGLSTFITAFFPSPPTELLLDKNQIDVIRNGRSVKTIFGLSHFELTKDKILLRQKGKSLEISGLNLSDKGLYELQIALGQWLKHQKQKGC